MIKKSIVCLILLFCAFFIGACIVEAEENIKTTTLSQLADVINNGEYTKYLKGDSNNPYLIAEVSGKNMILKLSSDLTKSINVVYDATDNTVNFSGETTDSVISEIYNSIVSMNFWILEACGYSVKDIKNLMVESFIVSEDFIDTTGSVNNLSISSVVDGDNVNSKIQMKAELNDKIYLLMQNGINKMKNIKYSNSITTDKNVPLELLVDIINNGVYTTNIIKPKLLNSPDIDFVNASIVDGNLVLTSLKDSTKSLTFTYNSVDNTLNFDRKIITDAIESGIFSSAADIRYWILEAYGVNLHDISVVILDTITDQETDFNNIGFTYLYDMKSFGTDGVEVDALLKVELSSKYFNYGSSLIEQYYKDLDEDVIIKDDSSNQEDEEIVEDTEEKEETKNDGDNPNTGLTDSFWIVLIALLGIFLVLLSQKNRKIYKI